MYKVIPKVITALNAVVATTTSAVIPIKNATKITLQFTRADHSAGNTAFTVTTSLDDSTFVAFNMLIDNVTNTNGQQLTRVASSTLSSNTTKFYSMDLTSFNFSSMKITATETTDGTHTAKALIEY